MAIKSTRLALLTVAALFIAPVFAGAAGAGTPYSSQGITLSNTRPAPGGTTTVSAEGYRPGCNVIISVGTTEVARTAADANGVATSTITVSAALAAGSTQIVHADCVDPAGDPLLLSAPMTLSGAVASATTQPAAPNQPAASASLPRTGSDSGMLAGIGIAVIAAGALLAFGAVTFNRRRTRSA